MSYHYQLNNNSSEYFDSHSYVPQMHMHSAYQPYYTTDSTSSMMTSAVTSSQSTDGSMMQTDPLKLEYSGSYWRPHESWSSSTTSSSSTWTSGAEMSLASLPHDTSSRISSATCYTDAYPIRQGPKKMPPPLPATLPARTRPVPKPFRCQICGKAFSQAANLTAHKRIHTGEKPFMCPVCNRPFSQSSSLVTHRRTHTGERPYPCAQCEKAFTDSSTLTKHLRTHTGHKPYVCSMCMMKFTQSGNLHRHMKTHKA